MLLAMCAALECVTAFKECRDFLPFSTIHMEECHEFQVLFLPPKVARRLRECQAVSPFLLCFVIFCLNFELEIQNNLIFDNLFVYALD